MTIQAALKKKTQITSNQRTSQHMVQQVLLFYLSLMRKFSNKLNKVKDLGNHFITLVVAQRILRNGEKHLQFMKMKCNDLAANILHTMY
jgi:hypothetical protein